MGYSEKTAMFQLWENEVNENFYNIAEKDMAGIGKTRRSMITGYK